MAIERSPKCTSSTGPQRHCPTRPVFLIRFLPGAANRQEHRIIRAAGDPERRQWKIVSKGFRRFPSSKFPETALLADSRIDRHQVLSFPATGSANFAADTPGIEAIP
jgi:hypothetical protein